MKKTILVTGAAGFIGSHFVETALLKGYRVIGYDALTYAGHLENIKHFQENPNFSFIHANILDGTLLEKALHDFRVSMVAHFAAESHVDQSIAGPGIFVQTNINGTYALLNASRAYFESLKGEEKNNFRFLHVSTDEVFGTLGAIGKFNETTPYSPTSPYAASKAASDHLVRAWFHTYQLPTIVTNCSNNYGPRQFPEKLIPYMVTAALREGTMPVYGNGLNVRDWIHVKDHCNGVLLALEKGVPGQTYCFGGNSERTNLEVVQAICKILDETKPRTDGMSYQGQIEFVADRPGHDFRYAIDDSKAQNELGFTRTISKFEDGLQETIAWYLDNLN